MLARAAMLCGLSALSALVVPVAACGGGDSGDAGPDATVDAHGFDSGIVEGGRDAPGFVDFGPPNLGVDAPAGPDADVPAPIVTFCEHLAQAICAAATPCMCVGIDDAACRTTQQGRCEGPFHDPRVEAALTAGTLHFDETAGDALVASVGAMPMCDSPASPLPITTAQLTTLAGVVAGTLADGATCMPLIDSGLAPTTCAMPDACLSGTCGAPFAGLGASCTPATSCVDLTAPATIPVFGRCLGGTCAALANDGEACMGDTDCASAVCNAAGTCDGPYPVGHACTAPSQCPGVCNAGTCGRGLTGDSCGADGADASCKSGTCAGGHCTGAVCLALSL